MQERFSLAGGRGCLTFREEGPRAVLEAVLPEDGKGIYKAYLIGSQGRVLLGTLMPEGGALRLRRMLSLDELKRKGVWPPQGAEVDLAFSAKGAEQAERYPEGWIGEPDPARLMGDALLARTASHMAGALLQRTVCGFYLAVPWSKQRPFPLSPVFCFAHIKRLDGRNYAVFAFNGEGQPIFPAPPGEEAGSCPHER